MDYALYRNSIIIKVQWSLKTANYGLLTFFDVKKVMVLEEVRIDDEEMSPLRYAADGQVQRKSMPIEIIINLRRT